jgi:DNA-binding transcriptional ArsR family regulator
MAEKRAQQREPDGVPDEGPGGPGGPGGPQLPTARLTDPRALRAYAHPTRMRLVGLLRMEGPFTATRAAELTGESVASCSYHLRMLAKYGLVEVAPGGRGREKPWRATARFTDWPEYSEDPAVAEAGRAVERVAAEHYFEQLNKAIEERPTLPREWQEATVFGDTVLHLTADELSDVGRKLAEVLRPYERRQEAREPRPDGARLVQVIRAGFPVSRPPAGDGGPR